MAAAPDSHKCSKYFFIWQFAIFSIARSSTERIPFALELSWFYDKIKKVIYGTPNINEIETTDIENMNGICRERQGRLVRDTKCFSKKKPKLINSL
jgi:hypothetical protein